MFDTPEPRGDKPNVLLPSKLDDPHDVQRMVELLTEVALYENRWAGDVLADMLRQPTAAISVNGPGVSNPSEPVPR
jgi:hypothetical protein